MRSATSVEKVSWAIDGGQGEGLGQYTDCDQSLREQEKVRRAWRRYKEIRSRLNMAEAGQATMKAKRMEEGGEREGREWMTAGETTRKVEDRCEEQESVANKVLRNYCIECTAWKEGKSLPPPPKYLPAGVGRVVTIGTTAGTATTDHLGCDYKYRSCDHVVVVLFLRCRAAGRPEKSIRKSSSSSYRVLILLVMKEHVSPCSLFHAFLHLELYQCSQLRTRVLCRQGMCQIHEKDTDADTESPTLTPTNVGTPAGRRPLKHPASEGSLPFALPSLAAVPRLVTNRSVELLMICTSRTTLYRVMRCCNNLNALAINNLEIRQQRSQLSRILYPPRTAVQSTPYPRRVEHRKEVACRGLRDQVNAVVSDL